MWTPGASLCLEGPALTNNPLDLDLFHSTAVMDPLGDFDLITRRLSRITRLTISSVDMPPSPARRRASATACLMVILFFGLDFFHGAFNFSAVSLARNVPTPPPSRPTFSVLSGAPTPSLHPSASTAPLIGAPSSSLSAFFFGVFFVVLFLFVSLPAAASAAPSNPPSLFFFPSLLRLSPSAFIAALVSSSAPPSHMTLCFARLTRSSSPSSYTTRCLPLAESYPATRPR